jgi:hypothetical protein
MGRPPLACRRRLSPTASAALFALGLAATGLARAQAVPQTIQGVPEQVTPTYLETGLPTFTIAPGTPTSGSTGTGSGSGSGGTGGGSDSQALGTMLSQSWGDAAANNAQAIGVSASAIAATCVLESACQNVAASGGGTVSGAFQMTNASYNADLAAALASDPSLSSDITQGLAGKMDPATEALAAAQDLKNAAQSLQAANIPDPTVLDVRGYYNFGASYGSAVAQASDDQSMASILQGTSPATLAANGITATTTVGQWRQGIVNKIGTTAYTSVLAG